MKNVVQNPEVGRVYLIRRFVVGNAHTKFQPGRILKREFLEPDDKSMFIGNYIDVQWLYDHQESIGMYEHAGSVLELDNTWVLKTYRQVNSEVGRLASQMEVLARLLDMKV